MGILVTPERFAREAGASVEINRELFPGPAQIVFPARGAGGNIWTLGLQEPVQFTNLNGSSQNYYQDRTCFVARPNSTTGVGECYRWKTTARPAVTAATMFAVVSPMLGYRAGLVYSPTNWGLEVEINVGAGTVRGSYVDNPTTAAFDATLSRAFANDVWYVIAVRLSGNTVSVFYDGSTASTTGGNGGIRADAYGMGQQEFGGATYYQRTALAGITGKALSNDNIFEILRDPYRVLTSVAPSVYFLPSAGGGGATITPTGLSSSAFGSFSVNAGDRIISFTGKASDEAFGTFNLRAKRLVSFTGKNSDEAFGAFSVHPGSVSILLNSKTTDEAYGTHSLLSGQKVISPTAKGSDSAFGSFIIISGDRILLINGVASNEAFGAFSVNNNTATQTVIPSGYFDSSIGSFSLRPDQYIIFSGKEYLEFGQFLLSGSAVVRAIHFFDWIAQQPGLRGSINDKLYQYLIAQGFTGSTPTMMFLWLRSLGYTGNTASMLTAFERDYTTRWY